MMNRGTLCVLLLCVLATADLEANGSSPAAPSERSHPATSVTAQASDPTAPIIQFQITDFYSPSVHGGDGGLNQLNIQPVIPVPASRWLSIDQILRVTVPYLTEPGPDGARGLGDVNLVELFVPQPRPKDVFGVGVTLTAPTASHRSLGAGKWQLGPAATWVHYGIPNWQIGGIVQNPISFAGDGTRDNVNTLLIQPIVNYLWGNWYLGAGDFNITFDWEKGELTLPLAFQVGKIQKIGRYHYNFSVEAEWTAVAPEDGIYPRWGIRLGAVILVVE